jgi:hypothetical protein
VDDFADAFTNFFTHLFGGLRDAFVEELSEILP